MAICTNKQEKLAKDLIQKLRLNRYFEYIAGSDTFPFNKPDPRHLTDVIEILSGGPVDLRLDPAVKEALETQKAQMEHGISGTFVPVESNYGGIKY